MKKYNILPKAELLTESLIEIKIRKSKSVVFNTVNRVRRSFLFFAIMVFPALAFIFAGAFDNTLWGLSAIFLVANSINVGLFLRNTSFHGRVADEPEKINNDFFIFFGVMVVPLLIMLFYAGRETAEKLTPIFLTGSFVFFAVWKIILPVPKYIIKRKRRNNCTLSVEAVLTDLESRKEASVMDMIVNVRTMLLDCACCEYIYCCGDNEYCLPLYNKNLFINNYGSKVTVNIDPYSPECFYSEEVFEKPSTKDLVYGLIFSVLLGIVWAVIAVFTLKYGISALFE